MQPSITAYWERKSDYYNNSQQFLVYVELVVFLDDIQVTVCVMEQRLLHALG